MVYTQVIARLPLPGTLMHSRLLHNISKAKELTDADHAYQTHQSTT